MLKLAKFGSHRAIVGTHFSTRFWFSQAARRWKRALTNQAEFSFQYSQALTPISGSAVIVAYLLSYFVEKAQGGMHFDTLVLRSVISALILFMMFRKFWLPHFVGQHHIVWLMFIGAILPYCFGTILILDAAYAPSDAPINLFAVMEYVLATFFLVQLVFHIPLIVVVWGISTSLVILQLSLLESPNIHAVASTFTFTLPFLFTVLLVGGIINKRLFNFQKEKEQAVWNVANAIAHQLRTPLATIRNLAKGSTNEMDILVRTYNLAVQKNLTTDLLSQRKLEILGDSLKGIQGEVNHSGALIDILIANSKPFETTDVPNRPIWISPIVRRAISEYPYNNPHERELVKLESSVDFRANALENMVLHVLFNLIGNAVEFSQKKSDAKVRVWLETSDEWNQIHVWDNGIGIPKENQLYIFEPFFSRNSQNGTGIGLSFCKSVMEGLGGNISCNSVEGSYSEFILNFPK